MTLKTLIEEIKTQRGTCEFEKWIEDSRMFITSKLVALNILADFHYKSMEKESFKQCMNSIEDHLQKVGKSPHPPDRIRLAVKLNNAILWNAIRTKFTQQIHIVRIVKYADIIDALAFVNFPLDEHSKENREPEFMHAKIVEFQELINSEKFKIPFPTLSNILWLTQYDDSFEFQHEKSSIIRDLLGLYHVDEYLVGVKFLNNDLKVDYYKPTVFHSGFGHHWSPFQNDDGWGCTTDLKTMDYGVYETVSRNTTWPKCTFVEFGQCNDILPNETQWENHFKKRLKEFFTWAQSNDEILQDLAYFDFTN